MYMCCCLVVCLNMSVRSMWSIVFSRHVYLLIFYPFLWVNNWSSLRPFYAINFFLLFQFLLYTFMGSDAVCIYNFYIFLLKWLIKIQRCSFSMETILDLISILSFTWVATPAFFCLLFTCMEYLFLSLHFKPIYVFKSKMSFL